MSEYVPRPFLKWAGGKGQILDEIDNNMPLHFERYFEPFVGGGAVFFHLWRKGFRGKAFLSDLNEELMITYKTVKDSVEKLIAELQSGTYKSDKDTFYAIRAWDQEVDYGKTDPVRRTARTIYLNKTCFNGLYRVNRTGNFNVPFGRYKNPTICNEESLRAVSESLQIAELACTDFESAVRTSKRGDFVYFDPPYHPLSGTAYFTEYTAEGFGEQEQERLAQVFRELHKRGCLLLQSNSSHKTILALYSDGDYIIESVKAKRAISCDPNTRGEIDELLIRNYSETRQQKLV